MDASRTPAFVQTVHDAQGVMQARAAGNVQSYRSIKAAPAEATENVRNDMYLASDSVRVLLKGAHADLGADDAARLKAMEGAVDQGARFIPPWVKISVALAPGLGAMVGWNRIVVTVGERIGKTHLSYAQGASAEIVAMATIGMADRYGLPVSTTRVLSSGVAGAMAANGSGLQWSTVRTMALAWVMTLPAAMALSGALFALFRQVL